MELETSRNRRAHASQAAMQSPFPLVALYVGLLNLGGAFAVRILCPCTSYSAVCTSIASVRSKA